MPLEKYMLYAFKDIFVNYLGIDVAQETKSVSSEDFTFIIVNFVCNIDDEALPVYMGYTNECLLKIHNAMVKKGDKLRELEEKDFKNFSIEVSNMLLNKLKRYISEYDKRDIRLSSPILCMHLKETKFSIQRYFKLDGEYLFAKY